MLPPKSDLCAQDSIGEFRDFLTYSSTSMRFTSSKLSMLCILITIIAVIFCFLPQKYDRRSYQVQDSEQSLWEDITPTMMSDEEDVGQNTF